MLPSPLAFPLAWTPVHGWVYLLLAFCTFYLPRQKTFEKAERRGKGHVMMVGTWVVGRMLAFSSALTTGRHGMAGIYAWLALAVERAGRRQAFCFGWPCLPALFLFLCLFSSHISLFFFSLSAFLSHCTLFLLSLLSLSTLTLIILLSLLSLPSCLLRGCASLSQGQGFGDTFGGSFGKEACIFACLCTCFCTYTHCKTFNLKWKAGKILRSGKTRNRVVVNSG